MTSFSILIILFSLTTVFAIEKFRRFHINETISTRIILRCPLSWSDDDTVLYYHLKNNGDQIQMTHDSDAKDSFVLDVPPEQQSGYFECRVIHKKDGSQEKLAYYIDRKGVFKDVQRLQYAITETTIHDKKLGESVSLACPIKGKESSYLWFGPDLLQLNNSLSNLEIASLRESDFGEYFCGPLSDLKDETLIVRKFVVKLLSVSYDPNLKNIAKQLLYSIFKLGERVLYRPPTAYTLTRRVIWEHPPGTILLNQGRDFNREIFTHDMTQEEFYYRESDRIDAEYFTAKRILFQSQKMGQSSFSVDINPSPATVIIGHSIELFCNNTNNLRAVWYYKPLSSSTRQSLPDGAIIRVEGLFTIVKINSSEPKHAGIYECDAKKDVAQVVLTVAPPPKLSVSPMEVVIRPGANARFLCQLIDGKGKVIWKRKDNKGFQLNVESRIGGDTQAILTIDKATKELNGSIYICTHNELTAEALLMVKDLCPQQKRACRSGDCIDANLFCDGKEDCSDRSDEDISMCVRCDPNQNACLDIDNKKPLQKCVVKHWFCDGDNDCGNGYDEYNCPKVDKNTCLSSNFACNDNQTLIPRSLWCDKSPNCPNGDDEFNCRQPEVVLPTKETTYVVHRNSSISLVCEVVSVPTSTINWRYNWDLLPHQLNFTIIQTGTDCNRIRNTLTIHNMNADYAGVYTCEAISTARAMAKDYTIFVTTGILCKRPYFNNAATFKEMCLKCFCSNVTDDCTSATGYFQSSTPKVSLHSRGYLMNFLTKKTMETGNSKSLFDPQTKIYQFYNDSYETFVINSNMYLTSHFGLSGSWLQSYSFYMIVRLKLTGVQLDDIPGPAVVIKSTSGRSLHWCRSENSPVIYSSEAGYVNILKLSLWEKEDWYNNIACTKSSDREDFLNVLTDVSEILIRIKYYTQQTGFELHNITLEHAIQSTKEGEIGVLAPRVEMCKCPFPFAGLSCEKCVEGYKRNSNNECIKKCPVNCDKCNDRNECIKCKGQRSGPQCLQCMPGYTRAADKNMLEDCVQCPCVDQSNMTMIGNECAREISANGKIQCKCTGKEINDASCNKCLRKPLLPEDENKCDKRTETDNPNCSKYGTEKIVDKTCKCKIPYQGEFCTQCQAGHFSYDGRCLKCFCSNATYQCQASTDYKFANLTLNSQDYKLNIKLTNRHLSGVYDAESKDGVIKIDRTDNSIVIKRNSNEKGLIYVTIKVEDPANPKSIDAYTMMYGGKIKFMFEYISDDLKQLVYSDVMPFLEIESKKFGRLWMPFQFNDENKFMEATLSEDSFPPWKLDKDDQTIDRETLIRALMTAEHLSVGVPFNNELVKKVRLRELIIEYARKGVDGGKVAPVEVCPCPTTGSGLKCEACNKEGYQSVMTLLPGLPDFVCGQCTSALCTKCAEGSFNYDFILNQNFSSCQQGIEITTKGRVIRLNRGESLSIPCSVKSFKGGVAVHYWSKRHDDAQLSTFRHLSRDGQSNLILNFNEIKLTDKGYYTCITKNAFSTASEEFYIDVIDKDPRLKIDIFALTEDKENIKFNASVFSPKSPTDYKVIWSVVKDGKVTTEESYKVKVISERSHFKIDVEIIANVTDGVQLRGVIVGSRVTNPFFYEIRRNITMNISINMEEVKFSTDKNVLNLKFLESGFVRVITSPNLRTETIWYKIEGNDTEVTLPYGITTRGSDLTVWSASETHNGKYVGYVINTADGSKIGKVYTEIKVTPIIPNIGREMFNVTRETNISIHLYVPLTNYCPNQIWELHNVQSGIVKDITKTVTRISEKEVVINYPLNLGDIVRFRCSVIPEAKVTGEIKICLESKYPILEVIPKFETSIYPVTLECVDKNTLYPSNITWYFNDKPIGNNSIIDWRNFGGFLPVIHEGKYTCFAKNSYNNASKVVKMPETRSSRAQGYIKITSSTNPIAFENGTLRIYLTAGQRFQVGATLFDLPPLGPEIKWFRNNNPIQPTKTGSLFSSLEIAVTTTEKHCGIYKVQVLLPNGTMVTKIFEIVPHNELQYYAKIDGLNANGDLSILEGDNRVIGCKLIRKENNTEKEESNIKINWKFVDTVGETVMFSDISGLKRTSDTRALDILNARNILNRFRGQCIVNYDGVIYTSKFFAFDVNQRNIDIRVKLIGLVENKYVANEEGATSEVICQAYDENSKRVLPNVEYTWELTFNVENKKMNWAKVIRNDNKITFGGLVYQDIANSSVGRCRVNYYGNILYSNEFSFLIKRKEMNITLPNIEIDIIYDTQQPPYPVAVASRDPKVSPEYKSNITFTVSNPNFERKPFTTKDGWFRIEFTTNGTSFNPYKDSGRYVFTVTNNFGYKIKEVLLPQQNNPNNNYTANIEIYPSAGQIDNGKLRVKGGSDIKLLCVYYGHPYPIYLKWTLKKTEHSNLITESADYWTSVTIKDFNAVTGSGEYECNGQSHQGILTKKVIIEGYSYGTKIEILTEKDLPMAKQTSLAQGNDFVIKYHATDLYTNKEVRNLNATWEFRYQNSDIFTEITNTTFTGEEVTYEGVQMTILKIARAGQIEIRCKLQNKDEIIVSESVIVNVKESYDLHPEPHFLPVYGQSSYPSKLKCLDTCQEPSKVVLSKTAGNFNEKLKITERTKESVADWTTFPFSPFYDMGTYKCEATNRYKKKSIFMELPEPKHDKKFQSFVKFESRVNEIATKDLNKTIDVIDGDKFMIICSYYGNISPISDPDIVFESKSGEAQSLNMFASKYETKSYYSSITIDKFNISKHSGIYTCRSRTINDNLIDTVSVQGIRPGMNVIVQGFDSENNLKLTMGSSGSFRCIAIDTISKKPVENVRYDWSLETVKGESFNIDDLSEMVKRKDGSIDLGIVKSNEDLRGRCEVSSKNGTFYSNYFHIKIVQDELRKPKLQFIIIPGSEERGFPTSLLCTDESQNISDITITHLSGSQTDTSLKKSRNSLSLIYPNTINNPLLYAGSYLCEATNKFGKNWKLIEIRYTPKLKSLVVKIESKDFPIVSKLDVKTIDIKAGKRIEVDCLYSGDNQPISANWFLTENSRIIKLERVNAVNGFLVYQKRSDCLSLVHEGFNQKASLILNCSAQDSNGTIQFDSVTINAIIVGTKMVITGLDNDTSVSAKQGSDKVLACKVLDLSSEQDISKTFTFSWQFTDEKGQKIELNQLSSKVINENGKLELNSLTNLDQTLTGRCLAHNATNNFTSSTFKYVVNQDDDKKPKINFIEIFGSKLQFPAKLQCTDKNDPNSDVTVLRVDTKSIPNEFIDKRKGSVIVTLPEKERDFISYEGVYGCKAINRYGSDQASLRISIKEALSVTLNSSVNKITKDEFGNLTTIVRKNRKLELNCYVTGTPMPQVKFSIITGPTNPDLPIPSRKIGLMPNDINSPYQVDVVTEKHYKLTRSYYSQSPPSSFSCDASTNGKTVTSQVKVIEVLDIYRVNIISYQQNQLNQNIYLDKPFEIGCEMRDNANNLVKMQSIQWTFKDQMGKSIDLNKLARKVVNKENTLTLDGVSLTYGNLIRGRCAMFVNETYDTLSDEFNLNIKESPKIQSIFGEITASSPKSMPIKFPTNYTYDAAINTEVKCLAKTTIDVQPLIKWIKCSDEACNSSVDVGSGNTLFFFEDSTKYSDVGEYRCITSLVVDNKVSSEAVGVINIKRKSAPKMFSPLNVESRHSISLTCDNVKSSPEGNLTWSFIPQGKTDAGNIPSEVTVKNNKQISILVINKPLKPEYGGTYICSVVNEYGSGGRQFNVKILSGFRQRI